MDALSCDDRTGVRDAARLAERNAEENEQLRAENEELGEQLQGLQERMDVIRAPFVNNAGVLWRRAQTAGFEDLPYCPKCHTLLSANRSRSLSSPAKAPT